MTNTSDPTRSAPTGAASYPSTTSGWQVTTVVSSAVVLVGLLVLSFVWPGARGEADGLSVAVTGDSQAVEQFMAAVGPGLGQVVDLEVVTDREVAVAGIQRRELIGGVVLDPTGSEVLTASAAGQVPSALMSAIAGELQTGLSSQMYEASRNGVPGLPDELPRVAVTDVVPLSVDDPNGVGITAAGIPLTVGALLSGVAIALTVAGVWRRVVAVLVFGLGSGLVLALVLGPWLGVLPASFGVSWLALSTSLAATSGLFVGLHSALGRAGLGVAAAVTLLAAMPWAAFAVPPSFLPAGLGHAGQFLIPGATATLNRTISYFPDAPIATTWLVLGAWAVVGLGLTLFWRPEREPRGPGDGTAGGR